MTKKLNANHLKLIAILAMTVDHVTDLIYPGFPPEPAAIFLHIIGRLTAPIMWFFVCEGFYYTRNVKKYMLRMGIFAAISHFAYCFAFGSGYIPFKGGLLNSPTSVMYPLFIAVVALWLEETKPPMKEWVRSGLTFVLIWSAFCSDWSCIAVLAILAMYKHRGNLEKQMRAILPYILVYAAVCFFLLNRVFGVVQFFVFLAYPLLKQYNGERGRAAWMKWLFYVYYPAHLVVIGVIRILLYGNMSILF